MTAPRPHLLHHLEAGNTTQPAMMLLHGFLGSSSDWKPLMKHLAPMYHCLAVDLPGHGASSDWPGNRFAMAATVQDLANVLDAYQIDSCTLVGYSMGGRMALYFALQVPERCDKLVLESASPGLKTEAERAARSTLDEKRAVRLETEDFDEFLRDWYGQELFSSLALHDGLVEAMIVARQQNDPHALAQSLREAGTGQQPSLWERLVALQVPTLAVAGGLDAKYVAIARQMAMLNKQVQVAVIPHAGHNVHAEQPAAFRELVTQFLA